MLRLLFRKALRAVLGELQRVRRAYWRLVRPSIHGAHAIALTPENTIILVKLRYVGGWHLPGGGQKRGETPRDNALRELREEIGMTSHGNVLLAQETRERKDYRQDHASVFIVRDVEYQPRRWSLEIEDVMEADLARLPIDISYRALGWIASSRDLLDGNTTTLTALPDPAAWASG